MPDISNMCVSRNKIPTLQMCTTAEQDISSSLILNVRFYPVFV